MEYHVPGSVDEALQTLAAYQEARRPALYVAGGTDLAVQIAERVVRPEALVDVGRIPALRGIQHNDGDLLVGAACTIAELAEAEGLPRCLVQGARAIGSPQIRALGTLGGNVCNASPCGDTLAPLVALDALLLLVSLKGEREVEAGSFFKGPKLTVRENEELLRRVRVPAGFLGGGSAFRMIGKRNGQAISQVNLAVWLRLSPGAGAIEDIRVAAGSVAPVPLRLAATEGILRGQVPQPDLLRQAEAEAAREIRPITDVRTTEDYRRGVIPALVREALDEALGQARGENGGKR